MIMEDLLFYDIEVFEYDALAVFMNMRSSPAKHWSVITITTMTIIFSPQ